MLEDKSWAKEWLAWPGYARMWTQLARSALHSFLDDFGHKEQDLLDDIKKLIEKLPAAEPETAA